MLSGHAVSSITFPFTHESIFIYAGLAFSFSRMS